MYTRALTTAYLESKALQVYISGSALKGLPEVMFSDNAKADQAIPRRVIIQILRKTHHEEGNFRLPQPVHHNGKYEIGDLRPVRDITVPLARSDGKLAPRGHHSDETQVDVPLSGLLFNEGRNASIEDLLIKMFSPRLAQDIFHQKERIMSKLQRYVASMWHVVVSLAVFVSAC